MSLLLDMGGKFHDAAGLPFPFAPKATEAAILNMMKAGCVLVSERGAIGGVIAPAWSNPEWIYACELFWWAEDGRGRELLSAFETWAKDIGACEIRMTSLEHLGTADIVLRRHGYERREISYGKRV